MTTNQLGRLFAGVAAASVMVASGAAFAQAAAPAAAPAIQHGPALANVCIFSNERAVTTSTVGKYVIDRMKQLSTTANAEINAEKSSIETEGKSLQAQQATLSAEAKNQRGQALQQRIQLLQRKAQVRGQELDATERKALQRVAGEMEPIVRAIYQQRSCSLLLDRNAVLVANPAMDLTDTVVTQLNSKLTQFPFEREHLEQPAGAAPAPAAKPPTKK
jgi:outer membrane protein